MWIIYFDNTRIVVVRYINLAMWKLPTFSMNVDALILCQIIQILQ